MTFLIRFVAMLGLAIATIPAFARDTHCGTDETPVFSCTLGRKLVSLCASTDLSASAGTLTYRFGPLGKVELAYPEPGTDPRRVFMRGLAMDGGSAGDFVRFARGGFTYTVYSEVVRGHGDIEGVVVAQGARIVSDLKCKDGALGQGGWSLLYKANLPMDENKTIRP